MWKSHSDLVRIAAKWARNRHQLVVTERGGTYEIPDVVAFSYSFTTLIECKVSRADFFRDKKKITRRHGDLCIGNYRIYCIPKGLVIEDEVPDDWGMLEVYPSGFVRLRTNIYTHRAPAIWWHEDTTTALKSERRILLNEFLYPKNYPLDTVGKNS